MTVKELMDITGKSRDAILDRIKKLFPDMEFKPRTKIILTDQQGREVLESYASSFTLSGDTIETHDKSEERTVRIVHEKVGIGAVTDLLKQLGKYLSKQEMHDFIVNNPSILAPEAPLQIETDKGTEDR